MQEIKKNIQFQRMNERASTYRAVLLLCHDYADYEIKDMEYILHDEEKEKYNSLIAHKRKKSFLFGRFCAKKALVEFCGISKLSEINISNGVFGQPIIHHSDIHNIQISISHTDNMAVAIAFEEAHPVAIDIEEINNDKGNFIQSHFTECEFLLLGKMPELLNISQTLFNFIIWSAIESLSKILKTGFTVPLDLFRIETIKSLEKENNKFLLTYNNFIQYKSIVFIVEGHVCSLTFPKNSFDFGII
jgi:4'-phosphopantetheinyl transferase